MAAPSSATQLSAMPEQQVPKDPQRTRMGLQLREVIGHYPTGVVVVSGIDDAGLPVGMTIGSFVSVSLDPPLVGFLPTRGSRSFERLRTAGSFVVNVLGADQEDLCRAFAAPGERKFEAVPWRPASSGAPIIEDAVAWVECTFEDVSEAGDHYLVLGRVQSLEVTRPVQPLLFFQGGYGRFTPSSLMALPDADLIRGVRLAELARPELDALARDLGTQCSLMSRAGGDLVITATAVAPGCSADTEVGSRVPLRAPLGDLYVAWRDEREVEQWLTDVHDPTERESYRARLVTARARGWSMSMVGDRDVDEMHSALRTYSSGHQTPSQRRRVEQDIAGMSAAYDPVELEGSGRYDVNSLVAPVFGAGGEVLQVLRLSRLPRGASGAEVLGWVERLTTSAARLSDVHAVAGPA